MADPIEPIDPSRPSSGAANSLLSQQTQNQQETQQNMNAAQKGSVGDSTSGSSLSRITVPNQNTHWIEIHFHCHPFQELSHYFLILPDFLV